MMTDMNSNPWRKVVVKGQWLKIASVHDEAWLERSEMEDPLIRAGEMRSQPQRADIFTFSQRLPDAKPVYAFPMENDSIAAIPLISYSDWWEKQLSNDARRDVRRAEKRGVIVKTVEFDDELVKGIMGVYNELPFRRGRPFWHYGKDVDTVRRENSTYLDRSDFLGAYHGSELIGFLKIVYVDQLACLMQILSKTSHFDKRPANALIAKAVEIGTSHKKLYLTYGNYAYANQSRSSLADFKHRNGFRQVHVPRYYLPLTLRGRMAIRFRMHLGFKRFIPSIVRFHFVEARSRFYERMQASSRGEQHAET